jgi:uncharacterized protein
MAFNLLEYKVEKGSFCHIEWQVTDLDKAKAFYGGLFGWSFEAFGDDYAMFKTPNKELGGGLMKMKEVKPGQSPMIYIDVESIEPYLTKAVKVGGSVMIGKTEIPNMGWFAILLDPDQNGVGIFESAPKA